MAEKTAAAIRIAQRQQARIKTFSAAFNTYKLNPSSNMENEMPKISKNQTNAHSVCILKNDTKDFLIWKLTRTFR